MKSGKPPERRPSSPRLNDRFQHFLLQLSSAAARGGDLPTLVRLFCRGARKFLNTSGSYYWQLDSGGELIGLDADGHLAARFRNSRLRLHDTAVAAQAARKRRTCYVNGLDANSYPMAGAFGARALMASPVIVFGEVIGVFAQLHTSKKNFFNSDIADKATILAAQLGSLLELARLRRGTDENRQRAEDLTGLALELNSSLRLPDFARNFTVRAVKMLKARAGALALAQGNLLETVVLYDPAGELERPIWRSFSAALTDFAAGSSESLVQLPAGGLLGDLARRLGWKNLTIARLNDPDGELLGMLCFAEMTSLDSQLLQAVLGQGAMALENCRLFSRITQASRHWVEIFDAIADPIVVHDEGLRILRANRALAESIGATPAELVGMSMRTLSSFSPEADGGACPFCRGDNAYDDDYVHPVVERTYLVSTSRIHGALEEGLQTIHVLKDITERREAERRYRELFDNIQEGLFFSTAEGKFVEVNDALVRMLGYANREQLLQQDIPTEIYFSARHRQEMQRELDRQGFLRNHESVLRRKDGSPMYTLQNTFAVRDAGGRVMQYRGLILDITEQKKFQSQLQRERDFNFSILNNTQSMILVADTAGLISYANRRCSQAETFFEGALLGQRLIEFVASSSRARLQDAFERTLQGEPVDNLELPLSRGKTRLGQFSVNLSPMRDEHGNITSIVVVMTDISDAAILQAKLMHTEKMAAIGQLVSGVAHEVNNPLTSVLGFADLLLENPRVPQEAKSDLNIIVQEAQRTKQIVQNLLSFARQMPAKRAPAQLNDLVRKTVQLRAYDFANHGVTVVEQIDNSLPEIVADEHQLQQVVLNILNNAYDAVSEAAPPKEIRVSTSQSQGFAQISVRDSGLGVNNLDRIFDPFFTTKDVGKGTGLGLSICYGIVHEHGGEILCANNEDGRGATFTVRLPLAEESEFALKQARAAGGQA